MDVPLRYPILFRGSQSVILDHSRGADKKDNEFPLFTKNVDVARTDYAIFLLNKDLAQVRWLCGLITSDLKSTLKNLYELLSLASKPKTHEQLEVDAPAAAAGSDRDNSRSDLSPDPPPPHHSDTELHTRVQFYRASMRPPSSPCLRLLSPPPSSSGASEAATQAAKDEPRAQGGTVGGDKDDAATDGEHVEPKSTPPSTPNEGSNSKSAARTKLPDPIETLELHANGGNTVSNGSNSSNSSSSSSDDTWTQFANRTQALSIQTTFQRKGHKVTRGGDANR